jgi:hypothetical protein
MQQKLEEIQQEINECLEDATLPAFSNVKEICLRGAQASAWKLISKIEEVLKPSNILQFKKKEVTKEEEDEIPW